MPNDAAENLLNLLSRWSGGRALSGKGGVRLICHQPQLAAQAYLHGLYAGLSRSEIVEIEATVGQPLPPRLLDFYTATNGARLFQGMVSVSGLVKNFSRDPSTPVPVSIEHDNQHFSIFRPEWHGKGYFRIGGISFLRQDELLCGSDDQIVVLHAQTGEPLRYYPDVFSCLESLTREMARFWTVEGVFTGDWSTINELVLGIGGTA
jgi:hypothetical protein